MKRTLILSSILFSVISVQADLVIHQHQIISIKPGSNETNSVIFSIRGDKTRSEVMHGDITNVFIYDLATHDSATLTDFSFLGKDLKRRSGASRQSEIDALKKQLGETNAMFAPPTQPIDTGKSEKVNGYETEIYCWSNHFGITETIWVAKDFPNYAAIKGELDKVNKWDRFRLNYDTEPDLSQLPGMVVKEEYAVKRPGDTTLFTTTLLISVKVEPVDPKIFEVPSDYTDRIPERPPIMVTPGK